MSGILEEMQKWNLWISLQICFALFALCECFQLVLPLDEQYIVLSTSSVLSWTCISKIPLLFYQKLILLIWWVIYLLCFYWTLLLGSSTYVIPPLCTFMFLTETPICVPSHASIFRVYLHQGSTSFQKSIWKSTQPPKEPLDKCVWAHELWTMNAVCDVSHCHFTAKACTVHLWDIHL